MLLAKINVSHWKKVDQNKLELLHLVSIVILPELIQAHKNAMFLFQV